MRKIIALIVLLIFMGFTMSGCNSVQVSSEAHVVSDVEILPTMSSKSGAPNRIWVGTFQIVWNELIDNIIKNPIEFVDGTTLTAKELNKREFNKTDISENSYYTTYDIMSPELKERIEKAIKEKFNEKSDILDSFDFSYNPNKYLIYAMLKKDFKFLFPFDNLKQDVFGNNPQQIDYFGIDDNSNPKLKRNVDVLFYNSEKDFAVKLATQAEDVVILYRTNDDKTFNEYFKDLTNKTTRSIADHIFKENDEIKIPNLNIFGSTNFEDVENRKIKDTDFVISKTIETVDFKMNNEGVKLKSEAAIEMTKQAIVQYKPPRYFYFDDNFVLFMIEKNKVIPYFAIKVADVASLNVTGKKD